MKKLLRGILLLSVFIFVINCKAQTTKSDFQTVNEELSQVGNGITPPPTVDDSNENGADGVKLQPLALNEFDIADKNDFNLKINSSYTTIKSIGIRFKIIGSAKEKITESEIWDNTKTEKGATLTLVKYKDANHEELKTAIQLKNMEYKGPDLNATTYHVLYNKNLLDALPHSGSEAVYRVDFALKDIRKDGKKYALTKRSFEFTITRE